MKARCICGLANEAKLDEQEELNMSMENMKERYFFVTIVAGDEIPVEYLRAALQAALELTFVSPSVVIAENH